MGDIHGAFNALVQCLKRVDFDYENDTLIQLGDVVDGNPQVYECVEELMKIKNLIAIKGNHDAWFQQFLETDFHPVIWNYGGLSTLESYLKHCQPNGKIIKTSSGYKTSMNAAEIPEKHKMFFEKQLLFYVDDQNRCFVHAGFDRTKMFHGQEESNYYFDRSLWLDALSLKKHLYETNCLTNFNEVFIGHTTTTRWDIYIPMNAFEIINLDTGAGHKGKLTITNASTKEFIQSDQI